jgi:CheY-like chemotaxis protein
MAERRVEHASCAVTLCPRERKIAWLSRTDEAVAWEPIEGQQRSDYVPVVAREAVNLVEHSIPAPEMRHRGVGRRFNDRIDLRLVAMRLELVAEHVQIRWRIVVRVGRAVKTGKAVTCPDPSKERIEIGNSQIARGVRKHHRSHAVQTLGCQHASNIISSSTERRLKRAGRPPELLNRALGNPDRAVAKSGRVGHHDNARPRRRRGRRLRRIGGGRPAATGNEEHRRNGPAPHPENIVRPVPFCAATIAPMPAGDVRLPGDPSSRRTGAVLLVEDDDSVRALIARMLTGEGFDVITARNGAEGLAALRTSRAIALVLLDLTMAGIDGWEFRRQQTADPQLAQIPIVIITGTALPAIDDATLQAADYLLKPVGREHLLSVVSAYCRPNKS